MGQIKAMAVRIADWLWEHEATGPAGHIEGTAVATRRIKTRKTEDQIPRSAALPVRSAWLPQPVGAVRQLPLTERPAQSGRPTAE